MELKQGDRFDFTVDAIEKGDRVVGVNYPNFLNDIEVGAIILIDNGLIRMKVPEGYLAVFHPMGI